MGYFIIVIGASAGGKDALCKFAATLPLDINGAVFIVLHLARKGIDNFLTDRLQKCTPLPCVLASDGSLIEKGHVYIAPVDTHLIVKKGIMHLTKGPAENRWRPSIDVLFRSAAVHYNGNTIGIILTGLLDDGTAGMQAIKRCGGTAIVQDPREAMYPDMPQSVLDNTMVDFVLPIAGMSEAIQYTTSAKPAEHTTVPDELKAETAFIEQSITAIYDVSKLGKQSVYACPDCGGGLWEIKDGEHVRYRCHVGHAFSESDLLRKQVESINTTLWVALRMIEERRNLLNKISQQEKSKNLHSLAEMHAERAGELEEHISKLKELLFTVKED